MKEVTLKFRDHDPKKGQPTERLTWNSKKFVAGQTYVVSEREAAILLTICARDGRPYFEKAEAVPAAPPSDEPKVPEEIKPRTHWKTKKR